MPFPSDAQPDLEVEALLEAEFDRQQTGLQLIASENFTSPAVMKALGQFSPTNMRRATRASAITVVIRSLTRLSRLRLRE